MANVKRPDLSGPGYRYLGRFRGGGIVAAGHNPGLGKAIRNLYVPKPTKTPGQTATNIRQLFKGGPVQGVMRRAIRKKGKLYL